MLTVHPILSPPHKYSILMGKSPRSKYMRNNVPRPAFLAGAVQALKLAPRLHDEMDFCFLRSESNNKK